MTPVLIVCVRSRQVPDIFINLMYSGGFGDPKRIGYLRFPYDLRKAKALLKEAGVALSEGALFGAQSAAFARLNFATSEPILDDLLDRTAELLADGT